MQFNAGWRTDALYFSFDVPDTRLSGTRTEPLGQLWLDDSVTMYLNFSDIEGKNIPDDKTFRVVVSAAGGATVQRGTVNGWYDDTNWFGISKSGTIRYGVKRYGEINSPGKKSEKYTVEVALSWDLLGIPAPIAGKNLSIGLAVLNHDIYNDNAKKYWPEILNDKSILKPSAWGRMTLLPDDGKIIVDKNAVSIPQMKNRPFIDGKPEDAEWANAAVINVALSPDKEGRHTELLNETPVIAAWYSTGKEETGICRPVIGCGNFVTPNMPVYYQRQFKTISKYGIDALIVTPDDLTPSFINAIVSAPLLNIPVPSVALGFNASDLTDIAIAGIATAKISAIPEFYRLTQVYNNKISYPIFIKDRNYTLLISDGKIIGKLLSANITPSIVDDSNAVITRRGGEEFRGQLIMANAISPDYIAINSYNDYVTGTAIAPTAQYGNTDLSTLLTNITLWRENQKKTLFLVGTDLPAFVTKGVSSKVKFRIKNNDAEAMSTEEGMRVEYKISRNDKVVASGTMDGEVKVPANSIGEIALNIVARDDKRRPLSSGIYNLEINIYSDAAAKVIIPIFTKKIASFSLPLTIKNSASENPKILINNENACKILAIEFPEQIIMPVTGVITVANYSSKNWSKDQVSIKCYMTTVDNREIKDATGFTKIENECLAGQVVQQRVTLTPPGFSGIFNCYFTIEIDGKPASLFGSALPMIRFATDERWKFIDISKSVNTWCSYNDTNNLFNRKNIDGKNNAFPSEEFLPDASGINNVYPVGYQTGCMPQINDPWFKFMLSEDGRNPAIYADKQKISIKETGKLIYIAGFAVDKKQNADFTIEYTDGSTQNISVAVPYWLDNPANDDVPVFRTTHIKTAFGNNKNFNGTVYSLTLPVDSNKEIASIVLPANDKIYFVAITVDTIKIAGNK